MQSHQPLSLMTQTLALRVLLCRWGGEHESMHVSAQGGKKQASEPPELGQLGDT